MSDTKTTISKVCLTCNVEHRIDIYLDDLMRFHNGTHAQDAFPYLTEDQRELLISEICGTCFEAMFAEDDEDEAPAKSSKKVLIVGGSVNPVAARLLKHLIPKGDSDES